MADAASGPGLPGAEVGASGFAFGGPPPTTGGGPLKPLSNPDSFIDSKLAQQLAQPQPVLQQNPLAWQRQLIKQWGPDIAGLIAPMLVPAAAPLAPAIRAGVSGLASGGAEYIASRDPQKALRAGLMGLGGQGVGEVAGKGVKTVLGQRQAAQMVREAPITAERALEGMATRIADTVKKQVPVWKDLPSDAKGLWSMAHGPAWKRVNEAYDQSMKAVLGAARGRTIEIPPEAAERLGLGSVGAGAKGMPTQQGIVRTLVDAGDAMEKVTGMWSKDPKTYRQVVRALDEAGIGDPQARAMYRSAASFKAFAERSKMLEGETLHPDRIQKALVTQKGNEALQRRGNTDLLNDLRASKPTPKPDLPEKTQVRVGHYPGALAGALVGSKLGHPWMGMAAGGAAGGAIGPKIPWYKNAPPVQLGTKGTWALEKAGPAAAGVGVRKAWDIIEALGQE